MCRIVASSLVVEYALRVARPRQEDSSALFLLVFTELFSRGTVAALLLDLVHWRDQLQSKVRNAYGRL